MAAKLDKRAVRYTGAVNPLAPRRCVFCAMFRRASYRGGPGCTLVAGPISPAGVCDRFSAGPGALR
jgi:hypothetical protein